MKLLNLALGTLILASSSTAYAHLSIVSHTSRHTSADQKVGPCGRANSKRGTKIYTYKPGETITIDISEDIPHPGWFRISFDDDGDDDFIAPKSIDPPSLMDNDAVLMDNLDPDMHGLGLAHSWEVKLPDVECDNCTLQVIQVMLDKLPYDPQDSGAFSNDIYYTCIDLELKSGASPGSSDAGRTADAAAQTDSGHGAGTDAGHSDSEDADSGTDEEPAQQQDAGRPDAGVKNDAGSTKQDANSAKRDAGSSRSDEDEEEEEEEEADDDGESQAKSDGGTEGGCSLSADHPQSTVFWSLVLVTLGALAARRRRVRNIHRH